MFGIITFHGNFRKQTWQFFDHVVTKYHTKYGEWVTIECLSFLGTTLRHMYAHMTASWRVQSRVRTHTSQRIYIHIYAHDLAIPSLYIRKRDGEEWDEIRVRFTYPISEEVLDGTLRRVGEFHEDQGLVFVKITMRRQTILDTCRQRRHFSVSQQWVLSRTRPLRKSAHSWRPC